MKKNNFVYSFTSHRPAKEIFKILQDVRTWWFGIYDESITGKSIKPGDEFTFKAGGGIHITTQKLIEVIPEKKLSWLVTKSNLGFLANPEEWKDTKFSFELSKTGKETKVVFTHEGLTPKIECYTQCSSGWTAYLEKLEKTLN